MSICDSLVGLPHNLKTQSGGGEISPVQESLLIGPAVETTRDHVKIAWDTRIVDDAPFERLELYGIGPDCQRSDFQGNEEVAFTLNGNDENDRWIGSLDKDAPEQPTVSRFNGKNRGLPGRFSLLMGMVGRQGRGRYVQSGGQSVHKKAVKQNRQRTSSPMRMKQVHKTRVRTVHPESRLQNELKVAVVSVAFAHPSTTFAGSDIQALRQLGAKVSVHDILFPHKEAVSNLRERGLEGLPFTALSWRSAHRGLLAAFSMPITTIRFLGWIVKHTHRKPGLLARCLALAPRSLEIFQRIRRDRPDVVHLFWGESPSMVGRLVRWKMPHVQLSMFLGAYDLVDLHPYSPEVARAADTVWTHSRANLPQLKKIGISVEQVKVCPRGIPIPKRGHESRVRNRVVTAGRLISTKGMDDTLGAFAVLREDVPDATLVVLGDGPERGYLEELARKLEVDDSVTFRGHVPRAEVFRELARAEAFLLMTRHPSERLPNVVKEAMAVGTVPVVCDAPGMDELVADGENGFIIPRGDVMEAVERVQEVLDRRGRCVRFKEAARARIRDDFDVRRSMQVYLSHWTLQNEASL